MLTAGEDPLYIARRMIVMASEDIGLANNDALPLALATYNACTIVGMPECRINLAHCCAYLAESPKSTRSYEAYNKVCCRQQPLKWEILNENTGGRAGSRGSLAASSYQRS